MSMFRTAAVAAALALTATTSALAQIPSCPASFAGYTFQMKNGDGLKFFTDGTVSWLSDGKKKAAGVKWTNAGPCKVSYTKYDLDKSIVFNPPAQVVITDTHPITRKAEPGFRVNTVVSFGRFDEESEK